MVALGFGNIFAVPGYLCFLALSYGQTPRSTTGEPVLPEKPTNISQVVDNEKATRYYTYDATKEPEVEGGLRVIGVSVEMEINKYLRNVVFNYPPPQTYDKELSFEFPFFGQTIRHVKIVPTGGYLFTGDDLSTLGASQFVAPLMSKFQFGSGSSVKYADNGTAFTVKWETLYHQDNPSIATFSFQTTLLNNGDIIFFYEKVPEFLRDETRNPFPVTVGLADTFVVDRPFHNIQRKIMYEYARIEVEESIIKDEAVVILKPLPTCSNFKSCGTCLDPKNKHLQCKWCEHTARCSSGIDRSRQQWLDGKCEENSVKSISECHS